MARASRGDVNQKENCPFAIKLKALMEEHAETQADIAEVTGKTRQTVSQYVHGVSEPGYATLVKIADHFHVTTDYLLGVSNDPQRQTSAVDELGLSIGAIKNIENLGNGNADDCRIRIVASRLIESRYFSEIIYNLFLFAEAEKASIFRSYASSISELSGCTLTTEDALRKITNQQSCSTALNKILRVKQSTTDFPTLGMSTMNILSDTSLSDIYASLAVSCFYKAMQEIGDDAVNIATNTSMKTIHPYAKNHIEKQKGTQHGND